MKIVVLSDTHLRAKMPQELLDMLKEADLVVHAGASLPLKSMKRLRPARNA